MTRPPGGCRLAVSGGGEGSHATWSRKVLPILFMRDTPTSRRGGCGSRPTAPYLQKPFIYADLVRSPEDMLGRVR